MRDFLNLVLIGVAIVGGLHGSPLTLPAPKTCTTQDGLFALSCANEMKVFATKASEYQSQSDDPGKREAFKKSCDTVDDCSKNICKGLQNKEFISVERNSVFRLPFSVFRGFFRSVFRLPSSVKFSVFRLPFSVFRGFPCSVFRLPSSVRKIFFRLPVSVFRQKKVVPFPSSVFREAKLYFRSTLEFMAALDTAKTYCVVINYVNGGFKKCGDKLQEAKSDCFANWKPFLDENDLKDKKKVEENCKNFFGKDQCLKKEIVDRCGQNDWDNLRDHFIKLDEEVLKQCNLKKIFV
ncbi:hypothetical protein B9Z55_016848 [Caenorhabditis nigoni]|uniref:T20D4.11-like domain-containing protein n=1 Tax=Caenorhabditis nigoni TaxID=1611254 RepID=A0A2G5T7D5_9PELO|nr:hypothetical protein B9Z55_016848 [Caenorhabditis nigoni]